MNTNYNKIFSESKCLTYADFENYINKNLSKSEIYRIEKHLNDCDMCQDELEGLSNLRDKKELTNIVKELNLAVNKKTNKREHKIIPFRIKKILLIAASIILFIGLGFTANFYINNQNKTILSSNEDVNKERREIKDLDKSNIDDKVFSTTYNDNKEDKKKSIDVNHDKIKKHVFSANNHLHETKKIRSKALSDFKAKKYQTANDGFEELIKQNKNNPEALYYSGLSLYNMKKFQTSLERLNKVLELKENKYTEDAEWYVAKIYKKLNNKKEAIKKYRTVIKRGNKYKTEAEKNLKEIEN